MPHNIYLFLLQIFLIIIIIYFSLYLVKISKSLKREERISKFAINSFKDEEDTFIDSVYYIYNKLISKISKLLSKSVFISRYASIYDKYISYEDRKTIKNIDFISKKILSGIGFTLLHIIMIIFTSLPFSMMSLLITFICGFFIPDLYYIYSFNKKRKKVSDDLLKAISIMNNAFRSGRNIIQAIDIVRHELDGSISDEFAKIYMDLNYGLSIDVVFDRFYERIKLPDVKYISSSLTLLNKTGGNIVKVFSSIEKSFYNKKKLENELKSMTSSSVFVFRVLVFLPIVFSLIIIMLNPVYFKPLITTGLGFMILMLILILYILYIFIIKRVMKVDI